MVSSSAVAVVTRSVSAQTLLIAAGGWVSLGLFVLYHTYAHDEEEASSTSRQCGLQVDRTPSLPDLTSSLTGSPGGSPGGSPASATSPHEAKKDAAHPRRDEAVGWAAGWTTKDNIKERPRGCKEKAADIKESLVTDELDALDAAVSTAAVRYNAQLGSESPVSTSPEICPPSAVLAADATCTPWSLHSSLHSLEQCEVPRPPAAPSKPDGSAGEAGQWDEAMDLQVLVQSVPPFAILEASREWLSFCGFGAAEVGHTQHHRSCFQINASPQPWPQPRSQPSALAALALKPMSSQRPYYHTTR